MPIKAVLLDLDNTLYDYERCNSAALDSVMNRLSSIFGKPKEAVEEIFGQSRDAVKLWLEDTASSHSRFLYFQKTIETLNQTTNVQLTKELHDHFWEVYFNQMKLSDGVLEFLEYLKNSGIKIAIVSDLTAETQFKKLLNLGLDKYVDFVITSEEAGMEKPSKEIFQLTLEKLGVSKNEVMFIGDNLEKDAQGAQNFGINFIHVSNGNFRNVIGSFKTLTSI